eukprot:5665560-Lingulodinium_polyedra.AAC.1
MQHVDGQATVRAEAKRVGEDRVAMSRRGLFRDSPEHEVERALRFLEEPDVRQVCVGLQTIVGFETQGRDVCNQSAAAAALGSLVVPQDQQLLGGLVRD